MSQESQIYSRAEFIVNSLAAGFAMAVLPTCSTVRTTDLKNIQAGEVKVPVKGGTVPAYRAYPETGSDFPVVLVVQEIFGVHEHIRDICRRFAKLGYYAIAPELFARQGDVSQMQDFKEIISKVVSRVPDEQVLTDLDASWKFAASSSLVNSERLAITGFCWGGRITWLYAAHNPKVKAACPWYGRLSGEKNSLQTHHPLDLVPKFKNVPILGFYAGQDQGIPMDQVEKMNKSLKDTGSTSEIILYPNSKHGFYADYRPMYDAKSAEDAWGKLLKHFKKNGV